MISENRFLYSWSHQNQTMKNIFTLKVTTRIEKLNSNSQAQ